MSQLTMKDSQAELQNAYQKTLESLKRKHAMELHQLNLAMSISSDLLVKGELKNPELPIPSYLLLDEFKLTEPVLQDILKKGNVPGHAFRNSRKFYFRSDVAPAVREFRPRKFSPKRKLSA